VKTRVSADIRRWARLPVAAVLVLASFAGLWLGFSTVASDGRPGAQARAAERGPAATTAAVPIRPAPASPVASSRWLATWGASPQPATPGNLSSRGFDDQTIRELVVTSVGGKLVRVRFANTYGARPLQIGAATIGIHSSGAAILGATARTLSFSGERSILIPPGAEALSDPVKLTIPPLRRLAISIFLPGPTGPATQHKIAAQTSYVAPGDQTGAGGASAFATSTHSWYFVAGVDVVPSRRSWGALVALGDSITDGVGSTLDGNARWPNDLARRLNARAGPTLSVIDAGIGGNRVLNDAPCCGANAVARFQRDVAGSARAREVILLEGVNDIGFSAHAGRASPTDVSAAEIVAGYEQIINQAHADGLRIYGATLTPFRGARYWTPGGEAKRAAVNTWIRTSRWFDGVIDFATVLADPSSPERMNPAYDSGDHLHPNSAGYRAMAGAINLAALLRDADPNR
jgi:lysophospholipase L1-like esterase